MLITQEEVWLDAQTYSGYIFSFLKSEFMKQYNPNILK